MDLSKLKFKAVKLTPEMLSKFQDATVAGCSLEILDASNITGEKLRRLMVKQDISIGKMAILLNLSKRKVYKLCKSKKIHGSTAMIIALIDEHPEAQEMIVKQFDNVKFDDFMKMVEEKANEQHADTL